MNLTTKPFRQSAAQCGRQAASRLIERRWWAFALPLAIALVASIWDWRFIVAAMALALVAYPFVLMVAYYSHALTPEGARAILRRTVTISDTGIDVVYEPYDDDSRAPSPERIPIAEVIGCEDRGDSLAIMLKARQIIIPVSALDRGDAAKIIAFLSGRSEGELA